MLKLITVNIANLVSIFRLIISFPISFLIYKKNLTLALSLFCIACITDYIDGYIARRYSLVSLSGVVLDYIADKILVILSLYSLTVIHYIDSYNIIAVLLIIAREILVLGIKDLATRKNINLSVINSAKLKTALQMISIIFIIFPYTYHIGIYILWIATIISVLSAYYYLKLCKEK